MFTFNAVRWQIKPEVGDTNQHNWFQLSTMSVSSRLRVGNLALYSRILVILMQVFKYNLWNTQYSTRKSNKLGYKMMLIVLFKWFNQLHYTRVLNCEAMGEWTTCTEIIPLNRTMRTTSSLSYCKYKNFYYFINIIIFAL